MLTSDLLRIKRDQGELIPRYLGPKGREKYAPLTEALVATVRASMGQPRDEVEAALDDIPSGSQDRLVHQGLRKLLLDRCSFEVPEGIDPIELRAQLFTAAASTRRTLGPTDAFPRATLVAEVAAALDIAPDALEERLFADLRGRERLLELKPIDPQDLLCRYDVALAQGVLLRATRVVVDLEGEEPVRVRNLFREARFRGLLHRVERVADGHFRIEFDGPFSLFKSVQKYGFELAVFLPSLLRCQRWSLHADVLWSKAKLPSTFRLGPADGLLAPSTRKPSPGPVTGLEKLVTGFQKLKSSWRVEPNEEIVALPGEVVCVPDLVFTHGETGETVWLEAFGFWSRKSVWQRIETIRRGFTGRIILAISQQLRVSEALLDDEHPGELYVYKSAMRPKAILERLETDRVVELRAPLTP
ncbi:MAG: DUF790 family protein [Myxococcota bacterium]